MSAQNDDTGEGKRELCDRFLLTGRCPLAKRDSNNSCPLLHATLPPPTDIIVSRNDRKYYRRRRWLMQVLPLDQVQMHLIHLKEGHREYHCIICNIDHLFMEELEETDYVIKDYSQERRCLQLMLYDVCDHVNCRHCAGLWGQVELIEEADEGEELTNFLARYYHQMKIVYGESCKMCASLDESTRNTMMAPSLRHHHHERTRLEHKTTLNYDIRDDTRFCWLCRNLSTETLWKLWADQDQTNSNNDKGVETLGLQEQPDELLDLIFTFIGCQRYSYKTLSSLFFVCKSFHRILKDTRYWHASPVRRLIKAPFFQEPWQKYKLLMRYLGSSYSQRTSIGECIDTIKTNKSTYKTLISQIASCNQHALPIGTCVEVRTVNLLPIDINSHDDSAEYSDDDTTSSNDSDTGLTIHSINRKIATIVSARISISENSVVVKYDLDNGLSIQHDNFGNAIENGITFDGKITFCEFHPLLEM